MAFNLDKFKPPKVDPNKGKSRYTVQHDRYDVRQLERLLKQVPMFSASRQKLVDDIAGEQGYDIGADMLWEFYKPDPIPEENIRTDRMVNNFVREEATGLEQFDSLRQWTVADDIGSTLAFQDIEPELEIIYDQLQKAQEKQQEYEEKLREQLEKEQEERSASDIWEDWMDQEDSEGKAQAEQNLQDAQEAAQEAREAAGQALQELQDMLDQMGPGVRTQLRQGLERAEDNAKSVAQACETWGTDPGDLRRMPAEKRLEIAQRINRSKAFKRAAELFGAVKRMAMAERRNRISSVPEEIYDIELGDDIPRVLPSELIRLEHPALKLLFYKDMIERHLLQYQMRGKDRVARGAVIYQRDGSGSMSGDPEVWATAVGLALMHVARKEKRSFIGMTYGSGYDPLLEWHFPKGEDISLDNVIDFAEKGLHGGGTDFQKPLNRAVELIKEEHERTGEVKADIIFATDGYCGVSDEWMKNFKAEQKKYGFKVWGINIGGSVDAEPLKTICDGRVISVQKLSSGDDVKQLFARL